MKKKDAKSKTIIDTTPQNLNNKHTSNPTQHTQHTHDEMTTWANDAELANAFKVMQQQIAELQAEILRMRAAAKQEGPSTKMSLSQKAGKVSDFDGRQDNWADWAFRSKSHVDGIHNGAEDFMEWAATQSEEIKKDDLKHHNNAEAQEISEVMYYLITRHTFGEALEVAKLVQRRNGAELWRKLSKRYDPRTSVKRAALLNTLTQQKSVSIDELSHTLDKWLARAKTYEDRANVKLQGDLKMTITQNMCPDALRLHLELNSSRLPTSDQMLAELRATLESRQPQAMEVDS